MNKPQPDNLTAPHALRLHAHHRNRAHGTRIVESLRREVQPSDTAYEPKGFICCALQFQLVMHSQRRV